MSAIAAEMRARLARADVRRSALLPLMPGVTKRLLYAVLSGRMEASPEFRQQFDAAFRTVAEQKAEEARRAGEEAARRMIEAAGAQEVAA